ncbi:MAG: YdeI/OmpD-associated family protein [Nostoc sp. NMS1]|uniref:YdeI/OmpD-associated family protein n=1 Tax=unclassified Nostoc TaxID=2593658 RepID=UPI0025D6CA55|nr:MULTISPECIES: YdeI/OmpD-associated family protein [unclassified Nostoc]MBN3908098.1 YdeI/OmpD-associated family protein [Nostoc sp. NMS1]MBN3990618.1 YdeI/OmpD-associated family protein [Nostoc sp. NMS2]
MNLFDDGGVVLFETSDAWEQWLTEHHRCAQLVWLQIAKKGASSKTVTYDEALDIALCFGWIDGQRKRQDERYFLQRFTPRRRGSLWSKRNVIKAIRLFEAGKVQPSGLAEIEVAQNDGCWHRAYDSSRSMSIPDDFLSALQKNRRAEECFNALNKASLYAIGFRLQTAKTPEIRQRRIDAVMKLLESG